MPGRRGLPQRIRNSHRPHYIETFQPRQTESLGRMIPIELLVPNQSQPRSDFSDLEELSRSIREKGVIEPLIVRPISKGKFEIVAGERRYRAATLLDLGELPCIERALDDRGALELSLVENLQRTDLHPFEEARGLRMLADQFGYTHQEIARRLGKSRSAVSETMGLADVDPETKSKCLEAGIASKNALYRIARTVTRAQRLRMVDEISRGIHDNASGPKGEKTPKRGRPRHYVFKFRPPGGSFTLTVRYRKSQVDVKEIEKALTMALESLA